MSGAFHGELTLPNQVASLALARSFLQQLAEMAELPAPDSATIVGAAFEACANVVDHAYEPGEDGTLTITADVDAAALSVAVRLRCRRRRLARAGVPSGFSDTWLAAGSAVMSVVMIVLVAVLENAQRQSDQAVQRKLNAVADFMCQTHVDDQQVNELRTAVGIEHRESTGHDQ